MICRPSTVFALVALSEVLPLAGCSDSKKGFTLKGSVTYQGKPLPSGVVRLHMADNRTAMAMVQPDGSFEATDVFPGEAKVAIEEDPAESQQRAMSAGRAASQAPGVGNQPSAPPVRIPPKYQDANTSSLRFNLKPGVPLTIPLE